MTRALMIIAHPDDDALFGGPFQRAHREMEWEIVCTTYHAAHQRGRELARWQALNGCRDLAFLDLPDDPGDYEGGVSSFTEADVLARLGPLDLRADLCLTHNGRGEYGHPHHVVVGAAARRWAMAAGVLVLEFGFDLAEVDFYVEVPDFFEAAAACFASQAHLLRIHHEEDGLCRTAGYRWHAFRS